MKSPQRVLRRVFVAAWAVALPIGAGGSAPTDSSVVRADVLVIYDGSSWISEEDAGGVIATLNWAGIPHRGIDRSTVELTAELLGSASVVVVDQIDLTGNEIVLLEAHVAAGGGLLAIGASGIGLESVLGLSEVSDLVFPVGPEGAQDAEVVFEASHPVTEGSHGSGPALTGPPLPAPEVPNLVQYFFPAWRPAYTAGPAGALVLARWYSTAAPWASETLGDAILSREMAGGGRTVYSGALPGIWRTWNWVRAWRVFLISAVDWLGGERYLPALEPWPHGQRAAFSWTGDTEMEAGESPLVTMRDRVDAILDVFAERGLTRFGTFFVVGKAGAAPDTWSEGAQENPTVVPRLEAAGAETAGHGDVHDEFTTGDLAAQTTRFVTMTGILDSFLDVERTRGFRAPHLAIDGAYPDRVTHTAAAAAGLDYLSNDLDVWAETTFPYWTGELWEAPPTGPMDYVLFEISEPLTDEEAARVWKDKLDYVASRRGMFTWLQHPWVAHQHLRALEEVLDYALGRGDLWFARQDDIVDWWALREGLTARGASWEGTRIRLTVHNGGSAPVAGASLRIKLPESYAAPPDVTVSGAPGVLLPAFLREHGGLPYLIAAVPAIPALGSLDLTVETRGTGIFQDGFETGGPDRWSSSRP